MAKITKDNIMDAIESTFTGVEGIVEHFKHGVVIHGHDGSILQTTHSTFTEHYIKSLKKEAKKR